MTTIAKRKGGSTNSRNIKESIAKELKPVNTEGTLKEIAISGIDIGPLNYRRVFLKKDLEEFAEELLRHGIISPLMVRKMPSGRFELVVGERRLRAAKIAKLKTVPTIIRLLTDDEVREIQLAENLKRENPHPLYESQQVAILQQGGKSIDEIAGRLGKSKAWVYIRVKLAELIVPLQEVFLADKVTLQEAADIALLSPESQQEFYDTYCTEWEKENFQLHNLRYSLSRLKYDLKKAPFNIKDKSLVPSAGACSTCPFNSATRVSLFPELAKEAVCSHKPCYKSKCLAHAEASICKALTDYKIEALLCARNISDEYRMIIDSLPELNALPEYSIADITVIEQPTPPDRYDFSDVYDDETDQEIPFDEKGYQQALEEYQTDLATYTERFNNPDSPKGLAVSNNEVNTVLFSLDKKGTYNEGEKVTAKAVQEAIKAGKATPELLEKGIVRIQDKEKRDQEIDRDKVQEQLHAQFFEETKASVLKQKCTQADHTGARLLIYQSLDYSIRSQVVQKLFGERNISTATKAELYEALGNLTEQQYCYLIRMAVAGKSDSKYPNNATAYCLYQMAGQSGTDVVGIEKAQDEKAKDRADKVALRIKDLENRIKRMKPVA